ncbi:hypothetical protein Tco_1035312 [Tanacetum coccineum]
MNILTMTLSLLPFLTVLLDNSLIGSFEPSLDSGSCARNVRGWRGLGAYLICMDEDEIRMMSAHDGASIKNVKGSIDALYVKVVIYKRIMCNQTADFTIGLHRDAEGSHVKPKGRDSKKPRRNGEPMKYKWRGDPTGAQRSGDLSKERVDHGRG